MKDPYTAQATKEELSEGKRRCWNPDCKKTAIIEDNGGCKWCWKHFWWQRGGYFSKMRKIIWSNLLK